jgi:hypothetical protein
LWWYEDVGAVANDRGEAVDVSVFVIRAGASGIDCGCNPWSEYGT